MFQYIQLIKVLKNILTLSKTNSIYFVSLYYDKTFTGANYRFEQLLKCSLQENNVFFLSQISILNHNHYVIPRFRSRLMKMFVNQTFQLFFWNHYVVFDSPFFFRNRKHYLLVHDPGGIFPNLRRNNIFKSLLFRFFLFCSNNFVCVSEYTNSILKRFYPNSKSIISYNGIDTQNCILNKDRDIDFLIITSGEKHKRDLTLISELLLKYPDKKFVVVTRSQILRKNFNVINNVLFFKDISRQEIYDLYCRSKYYTNFSRIEGFGIPIIEALTCGSKLLISNIQVYHEILNLYNKQKMINEKVFFINKKNYKIDIPNNLFFEVENDKNIFYPVDLPSNLEWNYIFKKLIFDIKSYD